MTDIRTEAPVTISIDLDAFVNHIRGGRGGRYGEDGEPSYAIDPLAEVAVSRLVADLRKEISQDVAKEARKQIGEQVKQIVSETLSGEYAVTSEYGHVTSSRTSLREQIAKEIGGWASKRTGDYGRGSSLMEKFIKENVDRAMQSDLKEVVESNRQVLKDHMRNAAAALLAAEAARR